VARILPSSQFVFNQRLSQIGLGRTPATHEQRSPTVYSKFLVVGPICFWSRGKYRVHRASRRRLRTVEQRRQVLARGRPGLHTMEQWSHMCSRRRCGMRSVEQRRVLCARGRFSLFSLEQRLPLRGGAGPGSVLNGRATASFKKSYLPLVHWAAEASKCYVFDVARGRGYSHQRSSRARARRQKRNTWPLTKPYPTCPRAPVVPVRRQCAGIDGYPIRSIFERMPSRTTTSPSMASSAVGPNAAQQQKRRREPSCPRPGRTLV
jgi:hypothetical protein